MAGTTLHCHQAATQLHREYMAASRLEENERSKIERAQIERTRRFQKWAGIGLALVVMLVVIGAVATAWQMREASRQEALIFSSHSDEAFRQGLYDRAMRYAIAALPAPGSTPLSVWSPEVQAEAIRAA